MASWIDSTGTRSDPDKPIVLNTNKPHSARMYDYYLGGKDHFPADRQTAELAAQSWKAVRVAARENRAFLGRVVRWLVHDAGIRQFLDIGTGLPSADNVHEVAQRVAPEARIVYVDNDPIVLVHAQALLTSTPEGRTTYLEADLRGPQAILDHPLLRQTLDLTQPTALMLVAILHFLADDDPTGIVRTLLDGLPSGSYLAASHVTPEHDPVGVKGLEATYRKGGIPAQARTAAAFTALAFTGTGLNLVDPGVALVSEWRPDPDVPQPRPTPAEVSWYGGVARKP